MHRELRSLMEKEGWTQSAVAEELGISQGYLSRYLKGASRPRQELRRKIIALTARCPQASPEQFALRVQEAAAKSTEFRALVEAALLLVEKKNKNE